ncbi:hypothetical protein [Streptomyces sp. NPDC014806]|uniref:hypothetical protein n=1 Tax=Streptomyces sp. NPDC014806 TaxID=3364920 RepID=UPI0036FABE35
MSEIMTVVRSALAEASSASWARRARAGRELAPHADVPQAAPVLLRLLLDAEDTAVTRQTAQALAAVGTVAAVRLLALAVADGDGNQADWLQTGVQDALIDTGGPGALAAACGTLAQDPGDAVRRGVARISAWIEETYGC